MNKELIETVESLGGTALFGGILIQFSDTTFSDAVKKIYEVGAEAEREACAKLCEKLWDTPTNGMATEEQSYGDKCASAIRARRQT
jgi:hypothetical protein